MTQYRKTMSLAAFTVAGLFLTGYVYSSDTASLPPAKSPAVQQKIPADITSENQELAFAKDLINNQDCVRAFQIFQKYADKGNPEAQAWLGRCYMNGFGTMKDYKKAYELFSKAAEKNEPWAVNGLGACKQFGWGTELDLQAAVELYKKAVELNHPLAAQNLAKLYSDLSSSIFDAKKAEMYCKKAMELNGPNAKSLYAQFLFFEGRYEEAVPLCRQTMDDPLSLMLLINCCQNGNGTPVDIGMSMKLAEAYYYKFGPEEWNAELFYEAALEELRVKGLTESVKHWTKLAAEQGFADAEYLYATILEDAHQEDLALSYMIRAADHGCRKALIKAGLMLKKQKDYRRAVKYYVLAATLPDETVQQRAVGALSSIYHYELKMPVAGGFWDIRGAELGADNCRNELAVKELRVKNDDARFAKAAALLAEGKFNGNEYAEEVLGRILAEEYDRLRLLADRKNPDALMALGIVGCMEKKGHPNIATGMELLEKSGNLNHPAACRILGDIYRLGEIMPKDMKKALAWYQKGAENNDPESARIAALIVHYEDTFKDVKLEERIKLFRKALSLDVMSVAYEFGQTMELLGKDMKKAEELYRQAASFEDTRAMVSLYFMLQKKNRDEAFAFLQNAVKLEDCTADLCMGDSHKHSKSPRAAFISYIKAKNHGDKCYAPYKLAECWLTGYGCEKNLKCFWKAAHESYQNGCPDVCYLLGSVYRDGKICAKDLKMARDYFEEGAKRGSEDCKKALNDL